VSDRLGFLSATGAIAAAIALLLVAAWSLIGGPVLFTPGPLNSVSKTQTLGGVTTHAQLTRCEACHTAPWSPKTMADLCMGCHTDVADQVQSRSGLHGRLVGGTKAASCRGCHTEHHGPTGALTIADATFPHDLTSYSLSGHRRSPSGAKVTCAQCHPTGLAHFDQATCTDCHIALSAAFMGGHETAYGTHCVNCHDGADRYGAGFDHNGFIFQLTGKHAALACDRCHAHAQSLQDMRNAPQDCYACHAKSDNHKGAFGKQCGQCHTSAAWTGAKFDHTVFPVDHGSREQVATCQTCHPTDVSTYTCFGCHAHTQNNIQARHEGRSLAELADCIRCHVGGRREGGDGGGGGGG
jgi:hypothetical protein